MLPLSVLMEKDWYITSREQFDLVDSLSSLSLYLSALFLFLFAQPVRNRFVFLCALWIDSLRSPSEEPFARKTFGSCGVRTHSHTHREAHSTTSMQQRRNKVHIEALQHCVVPAKPSGSFLCILFTTSFGSHQSDRFVCMEQGSRLVFGTIKNNYLKKNLSSMRQLECVRYFFFQTDLEVCIKSVCVLVEL